MRTLMAITFRDFKSITLNPLFFIIIGFLTIIWNINFINGLYNFSLASSNISFIKGDGLSLYHSVFLSHFIYYNLIILFVSPVLTMRLLSEEKRSGTYDLLLTSPVTSTQIVLSKFLAGLLSALCFIFVAFLYPFSVSFLTNFDWLPLVSVFLAVFFITSIYISIGLFASSLTSSTFLAVILATIFNFIVWFSGQFFPQTDNETIITLSDQLSMVKHLQYLLLAKIKLSSIVYFVTGTTLFIFLTQRVVDSSKWRS